MPSCSTVPITDRKQLSIIPEAKINQQAAAAYENFRSKSKLVTAGKELLKIQRPLFEIFLHLQLALNEF